MLPYHKIFSPIFETKMLVTKFSVSPCGNSVNDSLILPEANKKYQRGRRSLWTPEVLVNEDRLSADAFVREYEDSSNKRTRFRVLENFHTFTRLNTISFSEALPLFIGQCRRKGLMFSTIDTYFGYLRALPMTPTERRVYGRMSKLVAHAHADEEGRSEVVCEGDKAQLLSLLTAVPRDAEALLFLLLTTGGRLRDLSRLRRRQIVVKARALHVSFRVTKNRRKRSLRSSIAIPHKWLTAPSKRVFLFFKNGNKDQKIFANWNVAAANEMLSRLCAMVNLPRLTTRFFRKCFLTRAFAECNGDLELVTRYSLHLNKQTISAHYLKWSSEHVMATEEINYE